MAIKYLTAVVLFLATTFAVADHTIEHNAEEIDTNRRLILNNHSAISSHDGELWSLRSQDRDLRAGIALSNALGGHQFDFDHDGGQMSVGIGAHDGYFAGSVGFAVKPRENALINFAIGRSVRGDTGGSAHLSLQF